MPKVMSPTSELSGRRSTACESADLRKVSSSSMMQVSTTKKKTGGVAGDGEGDGDWYSMVVYWGKSSAGRLSTDIDE